MNAKTMIGVVLVVMGAAALGAAAFLAWGCDGPAPDPMPTAAPAPTPRPSFTPYVFPQATSAPQAALWVSCNAAADLTLVDARSGAVLVKGRCSPQQPARWMGLRPGNCLLRYRNAELEWADERRVELRAGENEREVLFPGIMEVQPIPAHATVEVDGEQFHGAVRLTYPAVQCPYTATVYAWADGYQEDGRLLLVEAGVRHAYVMTLLPQPTATPRPPTARPARPPQTAAPTTAPWTVEERVALVHQKLYEKANCWRAEAGLPPLAYVGEWQALADDMARAWLDYFLAHGPEGFDRSPWRQQFQAAGGDAATSSAGVVLYAPNYYENMVPGTRWESFDMCDPACPKYNYWSDRRLDLVRASGVVIGMAPWWNGDVLQAAVIIGIKW